MEASTQTAVQTSFLPCEAKSPSAFRTIGEVAGDLKLPQHVLRFWESKFRQIKPLRRGDDGRRYYRPDDVRTIKEIKELLYDRGFTIRGVQKLLSEHGSTSAARSMVAEPQVPNSIATTTPAAPVAKQAKPVANKLSSSHRVEIEGLLAELKSIRSVLRQTGI